MDVVWAVGDLHADAQCARAWIEHTGLVHNLDQQPQHWRWADPRASLVLMGDYIDKGPHAKETLAFVSSLSERFGDERVVALMGNHELNLLVDRNRPPGNRYMDHVFAVAHPESLVAWLPQRSPNSTRALGLLLDAVRGVYERNEHMQYRMNPELGPSSILSLIAAEEVELVRAELAQWQAAYLEGVGPTTPLGRWIQGRPLAARLAGTVFVHGGVPTGVSWADLDAANAELRSALASAADDAGSLDRLLARRPLIQTLVEDRKLHRDCARARRVARALNVSRVGVGHTPSLLAHESCDGALLALDSSLARWFRANGNLFCATAGSSELDGGGGGVCSRAGRTCEGAIARFVREAEHAGGGERWSAEIVHAPPGGLALENEGSSSLASEL